MYSEKLLENLIKVIDLSNITFEESYIDEKPKGNYWRGIKVKLNGMYLLDIHFDGKDTGFYITYKTIPTEILVDGEFVKLCNTSYIRDKEKVKEEALNCIINYFKLFQKQ